MANDYLRENALDPMIALQSGDRVREVYLREAEKTWDSFREEGMFRSDEEIDEALARSGRRSPTMNSRVL